jgi:hypothetical protein
MPPILLSAILLLTSRGDLDNFPNNLNKDFDE